MILEVTEYHADVYYNHKTGERVYADFPVGVVDDVNYGTDHQKCLAHVLRYLKDSM